MFMRRTRSWKSGSESQSGSTSRRGAHPGAPGTLLRRYPGLTFNTPSRTRHVPHPALADLGGDFVRAEARAWAEGHGGYGNGGAILPPVGLSGTHNGRSGFAGSGAASDWLSQAHVRMLSDDPVDLRGHGGRAGWPRASRAWGRDAGVRRSSWTRIDSGAVVASLVGAPCLIMRNRPSGATWYWRPPVPKARRK